MSEQTLSLQTFELFLEEAIGKGGFHNDDIAAVTLPLLEEVLTFHEAGKVGPLENLQYILITDQHLDIDEHYIRERKLNQAAIDRIDTYRNAAFDITSEQRATEVITQGGSYTESANEVQLDPDKPLTSPVYLPGYQNYEHKLGHHDELTDIFSLGMILASVSLGLNFNVPDDLKAFAERRTQLLYLNSGLHPAIANLIVEMTELHRHRRARDLYEIIERLRNFRDYRPELQYDLTVVHGFQKQDISSKQKWILNKLKSRLFDLSRRNRLLYFKPNLRFINLTAASVPNVLSVTSIKPETLFTWNDEIAAKVSGTSDIGLSKYLRFEDNPYLPAYLDKLRTEAARDRNEYGFSQLRLAICFLNWYNFKEDKNERIQTPLVLVPVQLIKKKGVKDQYIIQSQDAEAEVNPVLVYLLKDLYGLQLPDKIDLSQTTVQKLFSELQKQITANSSGIQLELIEKPRIRIIHTLAKQVLSQYNRRLRTRGAHFEHYKNIDYSYKPESYQPLGLQLFRRYVEPSASFTQLLIDENVGRSSAQHFKADEKERTFVTVGDETNNPFRWEFDLCNIVLGNFNYKKMSLVSDYNLIADNNITGKVFDDVFSDSPKDLYDGHVKSGLQEQFPVVTSDPTQTNAIAFSHINKSYIIQGPPGTGKSQTITNLIADYTARGKRVLFVCEKRAAIDVVYSRLAKQNLHELCCRIHDSRADKKQFILELKATYEKYLKEQVDVTALEIERSNLLMDMDAQVSLLTTYDQGLTAVSMQVGVSLRQLLQRLIELNESHKDIGAAELELMPDYKDWLEYGALVAKLNDVIRQGDGTSSWAEHPLSSLHKDIASQEQPVNYINNSVGQIQSLLRDIETDTAAKALPDEVRQNFARLQTMVRNALVVKPLAATGNLLLLDKNSARYMTFRQAVSDLMQLKSAYHQMQQKNTNWLSKISENDIAAAREIIEKHEGKFFSFLNGEFRRLKKLFNTSYNFSAHAVRPSMKQLITDLEKEYNALNEQNQFEKKTRSVLQLDSLSGTELLLETILHHQSENYFQELLRIPDADSVVIRLSQLSDKVNTASTLLNGLLEESAPKDIKQLNALLDQLIKSSGFLPQLVPILKELKRSPDSFMKFVNREPLNTQALEATIAYGDLLKAYSKQRDIDSTDAYAIRAAVDKLKELHKSWMRCNARLILARQHDNFKKNIKRADESSAGQSAAEKTWKRNYTDGRKILENEFGKQMRYKAIRELAMGNSGQLIKDLKPVWLMSPLSVSDTLPVDSSFFDVVIFDEASQITLEEGIPPVFRAAQSIIVGDEMQMPPSNFFGTATHDPEDIFDENNDSNVVLDAESLLTQAGRKLPDVMLGWHYRSRYENLISFSNNAFYKAGLLTIPDKTALRKNLNDITVAKADDAATNTTYLMDRSISYHHYPTAVYDQRTNSGEAAYIAYLVLSLLRQNCKDSIGVVAFSQEQQLEIENAIEALAEEWKMNAQLEEAYQRTEDDQFVGLFVKNLENVQGDERDIIIMSVCYGYDANKKMIMNFGPINRKGGEKRLNVIFSRAKKHIAVVSSIRHTDITNEYNEGANYFRKFLQYATMVSSGRNEDAAAILQSMSNKTNEKTIAKNIVVDEIAARLKAAGFTADKDLGQSYFKCQLGVRKKSDAEQYDLGILVDGDEPATDVMEKYFQRPQTMQAFGWNVIQVWTKDWFHKKEDVMKQIIAALDKKQE